MSVLLGFRACVLAALTTFVEGLAAGGASASSASAWRFRGIGLALGGSACGTLRFKPLGGAASAGAAWLKVGKNMGVKYGAKWKWPKIDG